MHHILYVYRKFLPYLASLIRPEEHIEGTACNRHVRGVVLAEPDTWQFPWYSFVGLKNERLYTMRSSYYNRWELNTCESKTRDLLLLLSDLQEVAAPVAVGVLRGQGERRARKVQLALGFLCFLRDSIPLVMRGDRQVWCHLVEIWGWSVEYGRNKYGIYLIPWTWRHTWRSCRRSRHPGWRSRQTRQLREWSSSWTCPEDKCNLRVINYMKFSSCIYMKSFKQTHLAHTGERPEQGPARSK